MVTTACTSADVVVTTLTRATEGLEGGVKAFDHCAASGDELVEGLEGVEQLK